jgi:hypothetical protein
MIPTRWEIIVTNPGSSDQTTRNQMSNGLYDRLKFVALVLLPALGTLYFALAGIWGIPAAEKVIGSITALDTFLGVILHLSTGQYYKSGSNFDGDVNVFPADDGGKKVQIAFNQPPEDVVDEPGKHSMEFKINHPGASGQ